MIKKNMTSKTNKITLANWLLFVAILYIYGTNMKV